MYNICPGGRCFDAVSVYCDMISESGVGVTVIGHDSESSIKVFTYLVLYESIYCFKMLATMATRHKHYNFGSKVFKPFVFYL